MRHGDVVARRYHIEETLGAGSLAVTYRARDEVTGEVVALKVVDAAGAVHLEREFFALRGLRHPHLARVIDYVRLDAGGALASAYIVGATLDRADLSAADAFAHALRDVASALAFLHAVGLIHGDVKPENVVVDPSGRATLIDLSCARTVGEPDVEVAGTVAWLAPERGARPVAPALDVYAFGTSMAELRRTRRLTLTPEARELLVRCSRSAADERPADGTAVAEALGAAAARTAITSRARSVFVGRTDVVGELDAWIDDLVCGRETPRVRHLVGPRGSGKSRLLVEARWRAQTRMHVVEIDTSACAPDVDPVLGAVRRALGDRASSLDEGGAPNVVTLARDVEALAGGPPVLFVVDDVERASPSTAHHLDALRRVVAGGDAAALLTASATARRDGGDLTLLPLTKDDVASFLAHAAPHLDVDVVHAETLGLPGRLVATVEGRGEGSSEAIPTVPASLLPALARVAASPWPLPSGLVGSADEVAALVATGWLVGVEPLRLAREDDRERLALAHPDAIARAHGELLDVASERAWSAARVLCHTVGVGGSNALIAEIAERVEAALDDRREVSPLLLAPWLRRDRRTAALVARVAVAVGDAHSALTIVARALRREPTPAGRAELRAIGAEASTRLGRPMAPARVRRALEQAPERRRGPLAAALALSLLKRGAYGEALVIARDVVSSAARVASTDVALDLAATAAQASSYLGDRAEAARWIARGEALAAERGGHCPVRLVHATAIVAYREGDGPRALVELERAVRAARREGNAELFASASISLGALLHESGAWGAARRAYEDAARTALALGMTPQRLTASFDLARLECDIGRAARARAHLDQAEASARLTSNAFMRAACAALRAEVAWLARDDEGYERAHEAARAGFRALDAGREVAEVELVDARRAARRGATEAARRALGRARDAAGASPADDLVAIFAFVEGLVAETPAERVRALERAAESADRSGLGALRPTILAEAATAYGAAGLGALAAEAERTARIAWERILAGLSPEDRDAFDAHPERSALREREPEPRPKGVRASLRLRELLTINRRLVGATTTTEVLEAALDAAIALTGAEQGTVLIGATAARLEVHLARDAGGRPSSARDTRYSRSIARRVLSTGEPLVSVDVESDESLSRTRSVHALGLRSVLAVPIRSASEAIGVLGVHTRSAARRFDEEALEVVSGFADQVAVALGRARLVDELAAQKAALERANARVRALSLAQAKQIAALEAPRRKRASGDAHPAFAAIVGSNVALRGVLDVVSRVADADVPLLVRGESGTGKELVARAAHERSARARAPFVAINCGALPETLLEAELFGYVRGAFTGATRDKDGLFTAAAGGTVFLDEIGEMPLPLQVKLLRVLQEREVLPLGATRPKSVDARVVSATHKVLADEIAAGRFREDLYYRIAVVEVVIPPLRERMEDVPEIVQRIVSRLAAKARRPPPVLTPFAMEQLLAARWPGNVRELENALARAFYLAEGGVIESFDLAPRVSTPPARASVGAPPAPIEVHAVPRGYKAVEAAQMRSVLVETGWNISEAARKLGVPRVTMHRRMKRYGLVPPAR